MTTTIQISEDNARQLAAVLQGSDCSPEELVNDVLRGYLRQDIFLKQKLEEAMQSIEAGKGIPHAQVVAMMQKRYGCNPS